VAATSQTFVSYSANHEDVMLNRIFGTYINGFYVDVGAAHPLFENDTRALYERGWHGINIEPNISFFNELMAQRTRDRNINAAVSDSSGEIAYYEVIGTGLSTCDVHEADRAAAKGFEVARHPVTAVTLRAVLEEAAPAVIDLLKVDVEGFELKVLSSNDWSQFRPKVIVVEATYPESPQRREDGVDVYLAGQGYRRVYFDGLNDFYVELTFQLSADVFDRPLNVFDHYESYELQVLRQERADAQIYIASLEQNLAQAKQELRHATLTAEACSLDLGRAREELCAMHERCRGLVAQQKQLQQVYLSTSWRVTRPLRALKQPLRALRILLGRPGY